MHLFTVLLFRLVQQLILFFFLLILIIFATFKFRLFICNPLIFLFTTLFAINNTVSCIDIISNPIFRVFHIIILFPINDSFLFTLGFRLIFIYFNFFFRLFLLLLTIPFIWLLSFYHFGLEHFQRRPLFGTVTDTIFHLIKIVFCNVLWARVLFE